jgi:ABC-2 type transport system permease protein
VIHDEFGQNDYRGKLQLALKFMSSQIWAILWAQFKIFRNRLPRTNAGSVLAGLVSLLWYGLFIGAGISFAAAIPRLSLADLREYLPIGLLVVFLFWQIIPLFTLSTGWSLQLNKLQIYPVSNSSFFGIEVLLRITTAPEMVFVTLGCLLGLLRHPALSLFSPLLVLLFIPLNLFLSLAIRELVLHSFERNRFRELFTIFIISISITPQILLRTGLGHKAYPYFFFIAHNRWTPWQYTATLSLGRFPLFETACLFCWLLVCYSLARWLFIRSMSFEDTLGSGSGNPTVAAKAQPRSRSLSSLVNLPNRLFSDPMAALVQKEITSLLRMPRFRISFGMACIFSVLIFVPIAWNSLSQGNNNFMHNNFLSVVTLYGLLMLSDVLLLNVFGLDRNAAQIYFVAPIPFATVMKAKNLAAILFLAIQALGVLFVVALVRIPVTGFNVISALIAAAVVGLFFISAGNLSSIAMARPTDPKQTFRKQSGGKMQLWLLLCSLTMFLLLGLALLAQWAFNSDWALLGVLAIELMVGLVIYYVALDSAVGRGLRDREQLIDALSKGAAPIGLGG